MIKSDEVALAAIAIGLEEEHEYASTLLLRDEIPPDVRDRVICAFFASAHIHDCGHVACVRAQLMSVRAMLHGTAYKTARMVN